MFRLPSTAAASRRSAAFCAVPAAKATTAATAAAAYAALGLKHVPSAFTAIGCVIVAAVYVHLAADSHWRGANTP